MENENPAREPSTQRDPAEEPAIDPERADQALSGRGYDTRGYSASYAADETDSTPEEVEEAWSAARADVTEEDLRLMDPSDRLEPGREPREGE